MLGLAAGAGVPVLVVAGEVYDDELPRLADTVEVVSLTARFGPGRARDDVAGCILEVVAGRLANGL